MTPLTAGVRRMAVFLAAAALVGGGLTGCGGDEPAPGSAPEAAQQAAAGLPETGPATGFATLVARRIKAAETVRITATSSLTGPTLQAESVARVAGGRVDWEVTARPPGGDSRLELRHVAGAEYLSFGDRWMRSDGGSPVAGMANTFASQVELMADPVAALRLLSVAGEMRREGPAPAGTKYVTSIDVRAAVRSGSPKSRPAFQALFAQGVKTVEIVYWLDETALPAKLQVTADVPGGRRFQGTARFSDWGKPVEIAAPPADQIVTPGSGSTR